MSPLLNATVTWCVPETDRNHNPYVFGWVLEGTGRVVHLDSASNLLVLIEDPDGNTLTHVDPLHVTNVVTAAQRAERRAQRLAEAERGPPTPLTPQWPEEWAPHLPGPPTKWWALGELKCTALPLSPAWGDDSE